ncbi:hypothetical protein STEG23_001005 [Scotinomys teguina]
MVTAVLSPVSPNARVPLTQIFGEPLPGEEKSTLFALVQPGAMHQSANFCDPPCVVLTCSTFRSLQLRFQRRGLGI